ncbi:transmembrane protein, putative [Medicago truncatula]|uniref:Transmembrane protein, putative n=1 Tax=Medicago truncatula TaxID=3880 RepID=A0A072VRD1_MEDTR|nr:transmembrane protein, putative [Medicago truncatula]
MTLWFQFHVTLVNHNVTSDIFFFLHRERSLLCIEILWELMLLYLELRLMMMFKVLVKKMMMMVVILMMNKI